MFLYMVIIELLQGGYMKLTTNLTEQSKLENASNKAKRLCKLYKCDLIELMIMSIDIESDRKAQNLK